VPFNTNNAVHPFHCYEYPHAKMAEPIKMLFGGRIVWAQGMMGVHMGTTWQIQLNDL